MENKKYRLANASVLAFPTADADRLLALRDGDCALLFLYFLRTDSGSSLDGAAADLGLSPERCRTAAARLQHAGLLGEAEGGLPLPPDNLPNYTAEDLTRRAGEDSTFRALIDETQKVLGHALSSADLTTLTGIYDRLGLPPDVIMLLIHHCARRASEKYGEGRTPTMRAIEKEAYVWTNRELLTYEAAEEYLNSLDRLRTDMGEVKTALQLGGRDLTPTEQKYILSWLEMGFSHEAIAIAYDRTVTSTGKLAWAYMNKILLSWKDKGLFTPADIEAKDGRGGPRRRPAAAPQNNSTFGDDDLARLERELGLGRQ